MIVDETDQAAGHPVFWDFLSQIRGYYIDRDQTPTFQSVILAGVYDIRNLKRRVRQQAILEAGGVEMHGNLLETGSRNSPWNISVDFKVDISFSPQDIAGMLEDYDKDYATGMDIVEMSDRIYAYTAGYPYLVSRLCKLIDEEVAGSRNFPQKKTPGHMLDFWKRSESF